MLKDKRQEIIKYIKDNIGLVNHNKKVMDIYEGNLLPYVSAILEASLSPQYFKAIEHRIVAINILQRYANKVSTTYSKPPQREVENGAHKDFLEYYETALEINNAAMNADIYSNLFKAFAWEPFVDLNMEPSLRVLPPDRFLVMSDSKVSPDEETIFIKFMGEVGFDESKALFHVYTDEEFDAFYLNGEEASEYLFDNQGVNLYSTIPFVYGKRQLNRLLPVPDTDMLSITTSIPVMISDMAGALMFQAWSILYGIDVNAENLTAAPNAFWSLKSDKDSEKNPSVGQLKPEADSQKVMEFVTNIFILWLETKGIRTGSMGNVQGGASASGISKIIDEMDAYEVKKKSMEWFKMDEQELWNKKLPLIHNYWIKSGMVDSSKVPPMVVGDVEVKVEFEKPTPMLSRSEELANVKAELDMGLITKEMAIKILHPDYDDLKVAEIVGQKEVVEPKKAIETMLF